MSTSAPCVAGVAGAVGAVGAVGAGAPHGGAGEGGGAEGSVVGDFEEEEGAEDGDYDFRSPHVSLDWCVATAGWCHVNI